MYSPVEEEVLIGATCTIIGEGQILIQQTNDSGDFWFDGLKTGSYTLEIQHNGKSKTIADINTEKDIGLGNIPLA
ncbi:MAG: carboxypeptidase-like regulatory domain-containing protein [Dehalococcoidia bacterium]